MKITKKKQLTDIENELVFNGYRVSVWNKFWKWSHNNVTILNTTELYT